MYGEGGGVIACFDSPVVFVLQSVMFSGKLQDL